MYECAVKGTQNCLFDAENIIGSIDGLGWTCSVHESSQLRSDVTLLSSDLKGSEYGRDCHPAASSGETCPLQHTTLHICVRRRIPVMGIAMGRSPGMRPQVTQLHRQAQAKSLWTPPCRLPSHCLWLKATTLQPPFLPPRRQNLERMESSALKVRPWGQRNLVKHTRCRK